MISQAMFLGPFISMFGDRKLLDFLHKPEQKDLVFKKELLEKSVIAPVIDNRYPFSEIP
jgi:hypothetical protein